jgi:diketogulonate reductase-like aldo/keto reductase
MKWHNITKLTLLLHTWLCCIPAVDAFLSNGRPTGFVMVSADLDGTKNDITNSPRRRHLLQVGGGMFGFFGSSDDKKEANADAPVAKRKPKGGPTNEVVKVVNGMKRRRLGGSDIFVSELGLGTQRWVSTDFNAPDKDLCYHFMDEAVLKRGVNLIDTAEQYPIPSDGKRASEGDTERVIGDWMKDRKVSRSDVVISTKITGGRNVTPKNIKKDCEESLKRLQTDYVDVYLLHWPQRYSPQSNWGQSLRYDLNYDTQSRRIFGDPTSFEDLCLAMEDLIQSGKIRGWGLCNDNAFGLTASSRTAKALGTTPPFTVS